MSPSRKTVIGEIWRAGEWDWLYFSCNSDTRLQCALCCLPSTRRNRHHWGLYFWHQCSVFWLCLCLKHGRKTSSKWLLSNRSSNWWRNIFQDVELDRSLHNGAFRWWDCWRLDWSGWDIVFSGWKVTSRWVTVGGSNIRLHDQQKPFLSGAWTG